VYATVAQETFFAYDQRRGDVNGFIHGFTFMRAKLFWHAFFSRCTSLQSHQDSRIQFQSRLATALTKKRGARDDDDDYQNDDVESSFPILTPPPYLAES